MNEPFLFDSTSQKEYIQVDYLLTLLRTLQYERYFSPNDEKEYVCVENIINNIQHCLDCYNEGGYDI